MIYDFDWGIDWNDWRLEWYSDYYDGPFTQVVVGPVWVFWRS